LHPLVIFWDGYATQVIGFLFKFIMIKLISQRQFEDVALIYGFNMVVMGVLEASTRGCVVILWIA